MTPPSLSDRLQGLQRELAQLHTQEVALASQLDDTRVRRLRCEGAVQYLRAMVEEERAKSSKGETAAPPAPAAPSPDTK